MMTELRSIHTEADYDAALAEVERLWGSASGTPDGESSAPTASRVESPAARSKSHQW